METGLNAFIALFAIASLWFVFRNLLPTKDSKELTLLKTPEWALHSDVTLTFKRRFYPEERSVFLTRELLKLEVFDGVLSPANCLTTLYNGKPLYLVSLPGDLGLLLPRGVTLTKKEYDGNPLWKLR